MKIKVAVVGFGHIGKRHSTIVSNNINYELVAIIDIKDPNELNFSGFEKIPFFRSLNEFFKSKIKTDFVTLATPNGFHEEQSISSISNGCNIVIEKPMALTKSGCEKIINLALKKQKSIYCVMQNRYTPTSKWLKEIVGSGVLGKIFLVQTNCFWNRDERYYKPDKNGFPSGWHGTKKLDGGPLFTQFSHFIDLLYWIFGDFENIQFISNNFSHSNSIEFEDSGLVSYNFKDKSQGIFSYSNSVFERNFESSISVIAENGTIKVGGQYMNEVEYVNIKNYNMPKLEQANPPNDYGPYKGSAANHHYVYDNIYKSLNGIEEITTNALEGLKVVEIIENIYSKSIK